MHHHSAVPNHVLSTDIGNYAFYVTCTSTPWQVSALHHVAGRPLRHHYYSHTKYTLSEAEHSQNGTLDTTNVHTKAAQVIAHASATAAAGRCLLQTQTSHGQEVQTEFLHDGVLTLVSGLAETLPGWQLQWT